MFCFSFFHTRSNGLLSRPVMVSISIGALLTSTAFFPPAPAAQERSLPPPLVLEEFISFDPDQAKIGQLLFYDKVLSGNRNISCGTCHHHDHAGTDALSLGIGEGGDGVGPARTPGTGPDRIEARIPRNAPSLWNLGHRSVQTLFHDGRLEVSEKHPSGFVSPAGDALPEGLNSIIAAQALFPITSHHEMAGGQEENEIGQAVVGGAAAGWPLLAARVREIPEYSSMFRSAFDHVEAPKDITIVEIANALAAFIGTEWRNYDSPFDLYLAEGVPLPEPAQRGMEIFFGKGGCAGCHSGPLFTDNDFHALALPAFGPGKPTPTDPLPRDLGRAFATGDPEDAYRFRTPSLRNVKLTAPYGHNGAYPTLRDMVSHVANPMVTRSQWQHEMAALPSAPWLAAKDFVLERNVEEMRLQTARLDLYPTALGPDEIQDLCAFLEALTGTTAEARPLGRPDTVPSGLPVD